MSRAVPSTVVVDDEPSAEDLVAVEALLGRRPSSAFRVVVRHVEDRSPVVLRNEPLMDNGRPMPTTYWLVGEPERTLVSRIESRGGVHRVEDEVGMENIAKAHRLYESERDALIDQTHNGPRPSGGVGGTRKGIKCLHAHYAWYLAGGDDPVGRWVAERLAAGEGQKEDWSDG